MEEHLSSHRCPGCDGQWIRGERYYLWLDSHEDEPETAGEEEARVTVHDSAGAKLCPECGRLLTRFQVGHGVEFAIDRCGGCGGIWLDAREWEVLRGKGLHDDVHFVFSAAWQSEIQRQRRRQNAERLLAEKLGEPDFDELKRIREWIDSHPRRNEIYAFLLNPQ